MSITVVTAHLPERRTMLMQMLEGFQQQERKPDVHVIGVDYARVGPYQMYQSLTSKVTTSHYCHFADDDIPYPNHLATMWEYAEEYDMVGTYCDAVGHKFDVYNQPFNAELVKQGQNIVTATALCSMELWHDLGGWRNVEFPKKRCYSDLDYLQRAVEAGAKITTVPVVTYGYRYHGRNLSHGELA